MLLVQYDKISSFQSRTLWWWYGIVDRACVLDGVRI